jgi:hypothetical protein
MINLLEKEWSKILDQNPAQTKTGASRETIGDYTLSNGNLNLSKAALTIAKLGELHVTSDGLKPRTTDIATQDCWPFLWWSICDPSWYGHLTRSKLPGGFIQNGARYNLPPFQVGTGPGYGPADVMGCGPAAFISLAHWWNEYGGRSWYGKTATGVTPYYSTVSSAFATPNSYSENGGKYAVNSFAKNMAAIQPDGLPLITAQMGGFWFVSGTLVTPQGFIDGGNAWLANQKSSYGIPNSVTVHGNYNVTVGIWGPVAFFGALSANTNAFNIADAIINETGSNDRPVIAAYPTGGSAGLAAHYSPILRFHIIKGGLATVWVNPLDTFTGSASWEVNLGNINNIVSGAFYLTP